MFDDQHGGSGQDLPQQGKLILPGYNNHNAPANPQGDTVFFSPTQAPSSPEHIQTYYPPAQPAQAQYTPPPQQLPYAQQQLPQYAPYGHIGAGPRKSSDPIYKFLIIAIVVVIFSGIVFAAFASGVAGHLLAQGSGSGQNATNINKSATNTAQQGNANGTQATVTAVIPTPTLIPTQAPSPTATQQQGQFALQITDIPQQVSNNSFVQVLVHSTAPNARVRLMVTYNVGGNDFKGNRKQADDNGDVRLNWTVHVRNFDQNGGNATATVIAVSFDQNGQQIESQPVNVQITGNNGGGNGNGNNGNGGNGNNGNGNGDGQN